MLARMARLLERFKRLWTAPAGKPVPPLTISEIASYEDYIRHARNTQENTLAARLFEKSLVPSKCCDFTFRGYCYPCRATVDFRVNFAFSYQDDGVWTPNWREHLACPYCHLSNRLRATLQVFHRVCRPTRASRIYIAEEISGVYRYLKRWFPSTQGSEYFGNSVHRGTRNRKGIRNEDLTQLSFVNDQFDYILTLDVLEHIPDYRRALAECFRCLQPGGMFFFSVPFDKKAVKNVARAFVSDQGEIIHVLPPDIHGDPLRSEGCLCFNNFGWQILDEIRDTGFADAKALMYWSRELGYLGGEQVLFVATKSAQRETV